MRSPNHYLVKSELRNADAHGSARQKNLARHVRVLGLLIVTLFFLSLNAAAQQPSKRVLILTGSDPNYPGFSIITRNIQSTLRDGSPTRVELLYELQQGLVNPPESLDRDKELANYLKRKYDNQHVDLILAMVAPRLRIVIKEDPALFANVPKVFYDFDAEREATNRSLGPNITGVWANLDLYKTLDLAFALQPGTQKVVVVSGTGSQDQLKRERAQAQFRPYEKRAEFSYLTGETIDELKVRLAALPKNSVVIFLTFSSDKMGHNYSGPEALAMIAPASSAPIYGYSDTLMGLGIVGGNLLDFDAIGGRIGQISLRVLAGERPEQIPQEIAPTVMAVDWRELQRWGVSEQTLPSGTVVRFRQPSFWELYGWYVIGLVAAVIVEAMLIAWLLFLHARRRQAENENMRLARLARAEHRRLDEIVSSVPGIVWETVIDPETKQEKPTYISDYLRKMLGYTPEEWLAAPPGFGLRIMAEEDRDRAIRDNEAVLASGKDAITQFRWTAKDGHMVWTESHLIPISDEKGKTVGLRGVTLDITERKLAAETLRKTEEKDRAILDAIPDLMFVQTRDGVYLDYHAKNPKDLLIPPEQFLGKNMRDVLPPELAQTFLQSFQRASENHGPQIVEYKLSLDNTDRWFEARIVRVGENILSVVRDITERKRATDELRHSEARFGKAFQANPQPMSLTTLEGGRYLDVNPSFLAMSGYTREEVIGHTSLELGIWETPQSRVDFIQQLRERGSVVNMETKFRTKDGSIRLLLSSAEQVEIAGEGEQCLLVASSDITERMLAQQALQESEARFRNMADTAPVMIWVAGADKLCTYFNQQWLDFTGRSLDQEVGTGWTEGVHPDNYAQCMETYLSSFDRREPFRMECRLRNAAGLYRWVFNIGTPRFSANKEFLGYIGSCVDITDRKKMEEDLHAALKEVNLLKNQLQEENIYLQEQIKLEKHFGEMIGESDELRYVLFKVEQVAPTDSTVLITGETGTGKELVARAIYNASLRKDRALVMVNCAALPVSLIESELFGHEKGSFTGATARKIGRFELANKATIFLDEIGELPMKAQVKLLRVLQEGEFERLGSSTTIKVSVRIIAATNRNLNDAVAKGRFREDLWYRLNVFPITVPPLRQRREDIPLLVEHFVRRFSKSMGKTITSVSPATLRILNDYSWPGNVRELANVVERGVINSRGSVLEIRDRLETAAAEQSRSATKTLEEMERDYIIRILEDRTWRIEGRNGAARMLGMNPSTLRTRMSKLGIQKPQALSATGNAD
ncbi:MAG TPA: sigma 54-interacting transcriptional regulator [Pyrinomonadaceae bacterium]